MKNLKKLIRKNLKWSLQKKVKMANKFKFMCQKNLKKFNFLIRYSSQFEAPEIL